MTDHYEEHLKHGVMPGNRCPELIARCDGLYLCRLTEKPSGRIHPCQREYGDECEIYEVSDAKV